MQTEVYFAFSGLGLVILLLILVTYAGVKIRRQNPSLFRRYIALVISVGVILPTTIIVVVNLPPPTEIELDITLDFQSNSTSDESTLLYHWEAPGIQEDVYGIHIDWREQYGECLNARGGVLTDLLVNRAVEDFAIQWTEFKPFANGTWTLLLNFYVGVVFEGQIIFRGNNESMNIESYQILDDYWSTTLLEDLESFGFEGLEIFMNISFKISAQALRSCFQVNAIDIQVSLDLHMVVKFFEFGIISG